MTNVPSALVRAERMQASLRNLAILTITTFLLLLGMGAYFINANHQLAVEGRQAHDAICALREDLQRRIATTEQFIRDHPEGIAGIPVAELERSVESQKLTVDSLYEAKCD